MTPSEEKGLSLGATTRHRYGCIVTAREQASRELLTLHREGNVVGALREIASNLERREGDWRILSISSPVSIWRDLQGARKRDVRTTDDNQGRRVEAQLLGKAGLDPHLLEEPARKVREASNRRKRRMEGR